MKFLCDSCEKYPCNDTEIKLMKYCPAYSPKPKPQTNADRIRGMTDEELAKYLDGVCHDLWQMFVADPEKMWLEWLKKEVEK